MVVDQGEGWFINSKIQYSGIHCDVFFYDENYVCKVDVNWTFISNKRLPLDTGHFVSVVSLYDLEFLEYMSLVLWLIGLISLPIL